MCLGAADYAAIGICIDAFSSSYSIDFIGVITNIAFVADVQLVGMLFCMHFVVITGVESRIVIDIVVLIQRICLLSTCKCKLRFAKKQGSTNVCAKQSAR